VKGAFEAQGAVEKRASLIDVTSLGLKSGLEIHQQLDCGKLFCRCPTVLREDKPDFEVVRFLRAAAGETGEVDAAAKHEMAKAKRFRYQGYHDVNCLVELDEEPPHEVNETALDATLQTAKLLGSTILDEVHVMRKTVVDGSNTSGFQRTALVAFGGRLHEEPVRIQTVCLEEDAAKIVTRSAGEDVYNLCRLGIPLIEIATEPDITSPEQAQRVAAELGMLLRSTGKCKRGIGTIRQDLNVSIKGGARVELKGAQELRLIADLVKNEALRQHGLLRIKDELGKRKVAEFLSPAPQNLTPQLLSTKCGFIAKAIKEGSSVMGIALPKMEGLLGYELLPGYRLGTELAGYAKTFGFGGIIHSDENLGKYPLSEEEVAAVHTGLHVKHGDAFLLVVGEAMRVNDFFAFLLLPRLEHLLHGVPSEVRKANPDGTSSFLRPMPGAARMYPETDIKRVHVDAAKVKMPKPLKEQEAELINKFKVAPQHAKELLREGWDIAAYAHDYRNLPASFIATTILDAPKEIRKRYNKDLELETHETILKEILSKANESAIPKEAVFELLVEVAAGGQPDYTKFQSMDAAEVERVVRSLIAADPDAPVNALMGRAMAQLRGKADGKAVMELLKKYIK
jgi:glutamyl-tRNA(Gln) amidotransferase subunit E